MNQKKRIFRILPLFLLATLLFTLGRLQEAKAADTSRRSFLRQQLR